jgi:betaine-aldehyde dehydrogenase
MQRLENYVDGKAIAPLSGQYMSIVNPSNGKSYIEAPLSTSEDVDAACEAAGRAFRPWRRVTPGERSLLLFRVADALEAHADEIVEAECRNTGKPLNFMRDIEFPGIVEYLRFYAAAARDMRGLAAGSYVTGHESSMRREPIGVCGQVAPWNYPLAMGVWKFGPAIAAGNTVVLKPSDTTPVSTLLAARIIGDILPPGVLNVVAGDRDTGRAIVSHQIPQLVSVTGSERAGIEVSAAAASDLKRVSLELGGKAPVLVFDDVDVAKAAAGIAEAGLLNAGQDCEAATRILVADAIYDEFVAALVDQARQRSTALIPMPRTARSTAPPNWRRSRASSNVFLRMPAY